MSRVYIDETGHTGENLLDDDQRFFAVSTVHCTATTAVNLRDRHFADVQAAELKFSSLKKYPKYLDRCARFLVDLAEREQEESIVRSYVFDKRYALLLKAIDYLIEPYFDDRGFNLYKDGAHLSFANICRLVLLAKGGERLYEQFLRPFQNAALENDPRRLAPMLVIAKRLSRKWEPFAVFERVLVEDRSQVNRSLRSLRTGSLDLALTATLRLTQEWRSLVADAPLEIVHDHSVNMSSQSDEWGFLTSVQRDPFQAPARDGRSVSYPVNVGKTSFVSSIDCLGVQLADVVAGALVGYLSDFGLQDGRSEIQSAVERLNEAMTIFDLLPSEKVLPEELGTVGTDGNEALNYLTWQYKNRGSVE